MDVGFETIGNATLICHDREPILATDPWITGGAYFGSWKLSHEVPSAQRDAIARCRFIWFSHGHPDHLNADSLPALSGKTILLPDHVGGRIKAELEAHGFNLRVLPDRQWVELSPRVRVLCIADYNQDAILLVDIDGRLIVNLNDASDRGWGKLVRRIIKRYPRSFLLALHGFGDADMLNYFDEDGRRLPLPPRAPLGQTIAQQCRYYGVRWFVPFSSMHRYQRSDSAWAAPVAARLEDYARGFDAEGCELLPAFIRFDCGRDTFERIAPPPTPELLHPPERFGDDWSEPLAPDEAARVAAYFQRIERVRETLDYITVRVGGREHHVRLARPPSRDPRVVVWPRRGRALTLEAPRKSLMTAIDYEVFDDLLIGNFARVTLHGDWGSRRLQPDFTPYVAKYADNGRARTRDELTRYFAEYRRRDPLGHAQHLFEIKVLLPLQAQSANAIRGTLGPQSAIYRRVKRTYWFLRRAM
jgi:hypothetical protein